MVSVKERSVLATFGTLIREDPVRAEINKMISCIKAANYSTEENNAEDAGYTDEKSGRGKSPVAIHVFEYVQIEKPILMGLMTRESLQKNPVCVLEFANECWKFPEKEIHNTEKLSDLYKHLKYYGLKIQLERVPDEVLNKIYIESREARPGAVDYPAPPDRPKE